ncbi:MAG: arylsulfatase [Balneolales bacterium]
MKTTIFLLIIYILVGCTPGTNQEIQKPNIIYIFADDLGYGELGTYGQQKIETPNIDALAQNGMKFTNHYAGSPVCAPSRYMLLTGKHPGNAYIRSNADRIIPESVNYDAYDNRYEAALEHPEVEGQISMRSSSVTMAEVLKDAGYVTGAVGKWGNGGPSTEGHPNKQGFDFFYGYLDQWLAHTYYPTHLWKNDQRVMLDNELVNPHQELSEELDPYDPESYDRFHNQPSYSAEMMQKETLQFIEDNREDPFFLYLPTPIPHVSVQAPQRWVDYYLEKFGNDEEPYLGDGYVPVRYPHATYAAMISYMDEQVGEIIEHLKDQGIYDNTLIMFSSDNGPASNGGADPDFFDSAAPFKGGAGWGKGYVTEGGIRVPMIVTWEGHIEAGRTTDHISALWDIMPTFSELAGITPPEDIDGISFLPILKGDENGQKQHEYLYWEFPAYGGQQAVRMGKWKGIRKNIISEANLDIELYDLNADMREQNNVADQYPEILNEVKYIMNNERTVPELDQFKMRALGDYQ